MAGTSQKTTTVGVRVPNELLGRWQFEAGRLGIATSAYVLKLAEQGAASADLRQQYEAAVESVATLQRQIDQLTARPEVDRTRHHAAGPVLASAVPAVAGQVGWSGLKGSEKKGKGK